MIPVKRRNAAIHKRNVERILKLCGGDETLAAKVVAPELRQPRYVPSANDALTVCITNFGRATLLDRALSSCRSAGIEQVVVASMEPDDAVHDVISSWQAGYLGWLTWTHLPVDLGCHELWVQAAYAATTDRVLILHDDDVLTPDFGHAYKTLIAPALSRGCAVTWRSAHLWEDGNVTPTEYWSGQTREYPINQLFELLMRSQLSLSPIVTVFHRNVLLRALKEAEQCLTAPESHLRPGMLLGTEVLAHLRQAQICHTWFYIDQVLSNYGVHEKSGTIIAERTSNTAELIKGYDLARHHFRVTPKAPEPEPRILLVYSDYEPHDEDEKRRCANAKASWQFHFNHGRILEVRVTDSDLKRTSKDIEDPRPVPYVKDLVEIGMAHAQREDIVVLVNRDILLTTEARDRIVAGVKRGQGVAVAIRRNWHSPAPRHLVRSVLNCKPDGGFDLFAFTRQWWKSNRDKIPDMLLGREAWDTVVRTVASESIVSDEVYVDNVIFHEAHRGHWEQERLTNPGQIHNRRLGLEFFRKRNTTMAQWVVKQLS